MSEAASGPKPSLDHDAIARAFEEILAGKAVRRATSDHLIAAYLHGIFPMAHGRRGPIEWVEPYTRGVFDLAAFHVPKNLAREVRRSRFEIRTDTAFESVMRACATARGPDNGTWMSETLLEAYLDLFDLGARVLQRIDPVPFGRQPGTAEPGAPLLFVIRQVERA